jgi:hypothetical protein
MKKLLIAALLLLTVFTVEAQHKTVMGYIHIGTDTYEESKVKFNTFIFSANEDTVSSYAKQNINICLSEIVIDNYTYNGKCGSLELFFGEEILYAVRFVENNCIDVIDTENFKVYFYKDNRLFRKYKQFWN